MVPTPRRAGLLRSVYHAPTTHACGKRFLPALEALGDVPRQLVWREFAWPGHDKSQAGEQGDVKHDDDGDGETERHGQPFACRSEAPLIYPTQLRLYARLGPSGRRTAVALLGGPTAGPVGGLGYRLGPAGTHRHANPEVERPKRDGT